MKKWVWGVLLVLVVGFIWGQSLLSQEKSAEESGRILQLITPFLEIFLGKGNVTHHLVRKLAHFTEFAALGLVLYGNCACHLKHRWGLTSCFFGFFTAFLDETIQIFSGRGPQIQDVWIDFFGVLAGVLFCEILQLIFHRRIFGTTHKA